MQVEGKVRLRWNNNGSVDPAVTPWGMGTLIITDNHFEEFNERFINFTAAIYGYAEFSRNTAHNFGACLLYLASNSAWDQRIRLAQKMLVFDYNILVNDDDYWSEPVGSYAQPVLVTGLACSVGWNHIEGMKTVLDNKDTSLYYLTCSYVYCHDNVAKNCGNCATTIGDGTIFHSKISPVLPSGEVGSAWYHNNSLIVDPDYFSNQGKPDPTWYLLKCTEVRAKFTGNYIDVPKLSTPGIANSESVVHSFEFTGNTLIVRDELTNPVVLRIEQAAASDSTERFDISDNDFDIAAYTTGTGQFIRFSSDVSHTRTGAVNIFPSTVHFNNNRIKLAGSWDWLFENSSNVTTFDGRNNYIEIDNFNQQAFSARCVFKTFQAKVVVTNQTGGSHNIYPGGEYTFFYDDECDIDLEFIGGDITNLLPLPINTEVLGATTTRVSVDCEVRQEDGDHCRGVFDYLLQDDGAGNLDMLFDVASSEVTAQIPDTTEQNGSNIDVTNMLTHGTDLFSGVALTNNVSRAYFELPTGYQVRVRVMKRDL